MDIEFAQAYDALPGDLAGVFSLALVSLGSFPILFVMTRAFRSRAELAYRATREAVALVIVHFVESLGGIHAVH